MNFSIRATIRGFVAPDHRLSCSTPLWRNGLRELHRRGGGCRESGAFLLGQQIGVQRVIRQFVFYDDLDPHALDSGIVVFDGAGYGPLWRLCRERQLRVVADVHTHADIARQSRDDRNNPMVATAGHIAIIVPNFAQHLNCYASLGVYEYAGAHQWHDHSGPSVKRFFYIGLWG